MNRRATELSGALSEFPVFAHFNALKTQTSSNKEVIRSSWATIAFGVIPLFLPLAIRAFGVPEGFFQPCDHSIWSIWVRCAQTVLSLRENGHLRRLRSSRCFMVVWALWLEV